jgi:hypothetical protein
VNVESREGVQTAQNAKMHECGLDKEILREYSKGFPSSARTTYILPDLVPSWEQDHP